jgi:hypothetical protein
MGKEEIKKLIEDSKKSLHEDHEKFSQSIKDDRQSFKK